MHIIHGTWIPDASTEFSQRGAFYVWVETDTPGSVPPGHHPRHLLHEELSAFLLQTLGFDPKSLYKISDTLVMHKQVFGLPIQPEPATPLATRHVLLPTVADSPAPSFELLRYMSEEEPLEFVLQPWAVQCYRVSEIMLALNALHFAALNDPDDFQLGADLVFWYQYCQSLKAVIARDQYIPAIKYEEHMPAKKGKGKRAQSAPSNFALYPGWEFISDTYESNIGLYSAALPPICAAGHDSPEATALWDATSLLCHFSECMLHSIVTQTPYIGLFDQKIARTLLQACVHPDNAFEMPDKATLFEDYQSWLLWRANLTRVQEAGFTLCFRLEDAPPEQVDNWYLHFFVASKRDPSLKLSLDTYWSHKASEREAVSAPFAHEFERELLLALGHAARIYPKIWSGLATEQPVGCPLTMMEAFSFLKESAWVLNDAGYTVIVPSWWTPQGRRRTKLRLKTSLKASNGSSATPSSHLALSKIVSYEYQLSVGGDVVTPEEWSQLVALKTPLVQFRGQWMELDRDKMQQMLQFWQTHQDEAPAVSLLDMLKMTQEAEDDVEWEHDTGLEDMLARLQDKNQFAPIADPPALQATLREYQKRGVAWLRYVEGLGLHPCLADDMGLGKTMQVIAHLLLEREAGATLPPTLIIAPTSVLGNWRREIERFGPQLRVFVHQGATRIKEKAAFAQTCVEHDVLLTSFALARLDEKLLQGVSWQRVVVDEAQNIKNPQAAQTRAILKLKAQYRLALTGTPVENRIRDLWSIFNFLNPGYLGREAQFRKSFELPIYRENNQHKLNTLKRLVEPLILRRVKTDKRIIDELPDKIEQKMYCALTPEQASLYEAVVKDVTEQLQEAEGMQRRGLILSTLLKLKQICNHPMQFLQDESAFTTERSHKLQRLAEMTEEVIASGESALIFTQFTAIGDELQRYFEREKHFNTYYLHGGTAPARRDLMVSEFQNPATEPSLFILSLRAGGVGLNLTRANHVFHFDRWWNPSVENQATDRAFRIGQRKNVFVHKFIAAGTMEERIDAMIEDKKRISSLVVGNDESWLTELDNDTFKDLITLRQSAVME